jgi:hypothetical protein
MNGPTEEPYYVCSRAYVFPTEADAVAWVGNVVIVTTLEDATLGDASLQQQDEAFAALSATYERVNAR